MTEFMRLIIGEVGTREREREGLKIQALPPSARYERRVGVSLVRAAWERRPEGPAYLLSIVMLLYLAGQCAFFGTHFPHRVIGTRRVFPEFLRAADGSFLGILNFKIQTLSPLARFQGGS